MRFWRCTTMRCRMLMPWCTTTGLGLCDASFVGLLDVGDRAPPLPSMHMLLLLLESVKRSTVAAASSGSTSRTIRSKVASCVDQTGGGYLSACVVSGGLASQPKLDSLTRSAAWMSIRLFWAAIFDGADLQSSRLASDVTIEAQALGRAISASISAVLRFEKHFSTYTLVWMSK